jgi:hypothetical protein
MIRSFRTLAAALPVIACAMAVDAAPQAGAIAAKLVPSMTAVARLTAEQMWSPRFDQIVQHAPSAAALGPRWSKDSAAWQKARAALGARLVTLLDAFERTKPLPRDLDTELARLFPGADAVALAAALEKPEGGALVRYQARNEFVVDMMAAVPNGPKPGEPEWQSQYAEWVKTFDARIGTVVPRDDGRYVNEAGAFMGTPLGRTFGRLWMSVLGKASVAITGAVNLMLFDDREAIARDIAAAVATVK